MANKVQLKRSAVPGKIPTTTDIDLGEIAINTFDGKAYIKKSASGTESIVQLNSIGLGDVVGPSVSTDNAIARFDGITGKVIQDSTATIDDSGNLISLTQVSTGTSANKMPVGTTAQRPTGTIGFYRMNSTTGEPEWWSPNDNNWVSFRETPSLIIEYIVIAGGGSGGLGGGGAGGYRSSVTGESSGGGTSAEAKLTLPKGAYTVTIGAGGSANSNGSNSIFASITSIGGGAGGNPTITTNGDGQSGGSGGGGSSNSIGTVVGNAGSGTIGQGRNGGIGTITGGFGKGGGGGANTVGSNAVTTSGGNGGAGVTSSINGSAIARAGGGGGGSSNASGAIGGTGGAGGGGNGGGGLNAAGTVGIANTGGGGGGKSSISVAALSGGSGVVIVKYIGTQSATGGTVSFSGGYTIHTFTSSGTFTID